MGLLDQCQALFGTSGLYEVVGVARKASEAELRRGYYKSSLRVHPDRAPDDPEATAKFQTLGKVYAVLSDSQQRAIYDEQGTIEEDSESVDSERDWSKSGVHTQDIVDFEQTYVGSEEERKDLLRVYRDCQGDLSLILDHALFGSHAHEARITGILQAAIDEGQIPALKAFTHESSKKKASRKRKAQKEEEECEQMKKELGLEENSLTALIKKNSASREAGFSSLISSLEQKYCQKKPSASKKKTASSSSSSSKKKTSASSSSSSSKKITTASSSSSSSKKITSAASSSSKKTGGSRSKK